MTKQQLLALLREAFNMGYESSSRYHCDIAGDLMNDHGFIDLVEHTNRVGDLELPVLSSDTQCEHEYVTGYDHGTCKKCGWIFTDGGWGIAKRMWFKSLDDAKFYKQHGRLPQPPEGV